MFQNFIFDRTIQIQGQCIPHTIRVWILKYPIIDSCGAAAGLTHSYPERPLIKFKHMQISLRKVRKISNKIFSLKHKE